MGAKLHLGLGVDGYSAEEAKIMADELHKPIKRKFDRRKVFIKDIDDTWAVDLMEMNTVIGPKHYKFRYIFVAHDLFSKYCLAFALTNKMKETLIECIKMMLTFAPNLKKIWSDHESGLWSKDCKTFLSSKEIVLYQTFSEKKCGPAERMNITLRDLIHIKETEN